MRVAKAFNTDITFPVVITTVPPSAQPSIDPVLSHQIYRALANYLASRVAAELANDNAVEETEVGGQTVSDGSGALANGRCSSIENSKKLGMYNCFERQMRSPRGERAGCRNERFVFWDTWLYADLSSHCYMLSWSLFGVDPGWNDVFKICRLLDRDQIWLIV